MTNWPRAVAVALLGIVALVAIQQRADTPGVPEAPPGFSAAEGPGASAPGQVVGAGGRTHVSDVAVLTNLGVTPQWIAIQATGPVPESCRVALTDGPLQTPEDFGSVRGLLVPVGGQAHVGIGFAPGVTGELGCWYSLYNDGQ